MARSMMRKSSTSPAMPMPAWPSGVTAGARVEAQNGEVAGAATEVADQHGRGFGKCSGEAGAGGFRLQRQRHLGEARLGVCAAQAVGPKRIIREFASEVDRTADNDAR